MCGYGWVGVGVCVCWGENDSGVNHFFTKME
jgi:hypothetical protein